MFSFDAHTQKKEEKKGKGNSCTDETVVLINIVALRIRDCEQGRYSTMRNMYFIYVVKAGMID
jgi:hypothetical protein